MMDGNTERCRLQFLYREIVFNAETTLNYAD